MVRREIGSTFKELDMNRVLYIAFLLLPVNLKAAGKFYLLEATHLSVEAHRLDTLREPYLPEYDRVNKEATTKDQKEEWEYGAKVNFNLNLVRLFRYSIFWRNTIHGEATDNQFRQVGWKWELGVTIIPKKIELFHLHHSQHVLEKTTDLGDNYPIRDSVGLRLIFLDK